MNSLTSSVMTRDLLVNWRYCLANILSTLDELSQWVEFNENGHKTQLLFFQFIKHPEIKLCLEIRSLNFLIPPF